MLINENSAFRVREKSPFRNGRGFFLCGFDAFFSGISGGQVMAHLLSN